MKCGGHEDDLTVVVDVVGVVPSVLTGVVDDLTVVVVEVTDVVVVGANVVTFSQLQVLESNTKPLGHVLIGQIH